MGAGRQRELTRAEVEAVGVRVRDPQGRREAWKKQEDKKWERLRETNIHRTGRVDTQVEA